MVNLHITRGEVAEILAEKLTDNLRNSRDMQVGGGRHDPNPEPIPDRFLYITIKSWALSGIRGNPIPNFLNHNTSSLRNQSSHYSNRY